MKSPEETASDGELHTELLILPDGRILVHNLTPAFAELLAQLNPDCASIQSRTAPGELSSRHELSY
ncbi:MAG TPA: hypothetical protein VEH04_02280 [Verrucomicrobiae bacterium]|nr:hypothetical protein [Verrucomicrobiae bacterium]